MEGTIAAAVVLTIACVCLLGIALAASCVILAVTAARLVQWLRTEFSHATEVVIRHQDQGRNYQGKAAADAVAAARQEPVAVVDATPSSGPVTMAHGLMEEQLKGMAADAQNLLGP